MASDVTCLFFQPLCVTSRSTWGWWSFSTDGDSLLGCCSQHTSRVQHRQHNLCIYFVKIKQHSFSWEKSVCVCRAFCHPDTGRGLQALKTVKVRCWMEGSTSSFIAGFFFSFFLFINLFVLVNFNVVPVLHQPGQLLISLPESCLLTTSTVLDSYLGYYIKRQAHANIHSQVPSFKMSKIAFGHFFVSTTALQLWFKSCYVLQIGYEIVSGLFVALSYF